MAERSKIGRVFAVALFGGAVGVLLHLTLTYEPPASVARLTEAMELLAVAADQYADDMAGFQAELAEMSATLAALRETMEGMTK